MAARIRLPLLLASLVAAAAQDADIILGAGNVCPDERVKVHKATACNKARKLVPEVSGRFNGKEKSAKWPSGCYYCKDVPDCEDGFWYNKHPEGAANGDARPLCAVKDSSGGGGGGNHQDIMLVGDSDIEYWPRGKSKKAFPDSVNVGVGGWTCSQVKKRIDGFLKKYTPTWAVLVCGENDMGEDRSVEATFKDFKTIVSQILNTGARVLYIGTKPEPGTKELHGKYRNYDELIRNFASTLGKDASDGETPFIMIDSYRSFEDLGNSKKFYQRDKLHLSMKGYNKWSSWAKDAIAMASTSCEVWQSGECTQGSV